MGLRGTRIRGFTLIELMMVSAIIGLLAAIAVPKFGDLIIKAKEANVKAKLGALRSAIHIYYADNEGIFPKVIGNSLAVALTRGGKYLDSIPTIQIPRTNHLPFNSVDIFPGDWQMADGGGVWNYTLNGRISVNCFHLDSSGRVWSTW